MCIHLIKEILMLDYRNISVFSQTPLDVLYNIWYMHYIPSKKQSEFWNTSGLKDFGQGDGTTSFSWYLCVLNTIDLHYFFSSYNSVR